MERETNAQLDNCSLYISRAVLITPKQKIALKVQDLAFTEKV